MLIPFFEALTETVLMVVLSSIISAAVAFPLAYVLIYAYLLDNPVGKIVTKYISQTFNIIKSTPFLLFILLIVPYLKTVEYDIPNYLAAIIPLAAISIILLTQELYLIATIRSVKILELARKLSASPKQTILLMLLPSNIQTISIALGKTAIRLVGYSTIAGALGFGGLGDLVINDMDSENTSLLILCMLVIIAFNKIIDYTFSSFTRITQKLH